MSDCLLLCFLTDKAELTPNGVESSQGVVARQTPPPSSPSGRSPAASSSSNSSSPSPGQDALAPTTIMEPNPNAPSSTEQACNPAESTTDSLPAG